MTQGTLNEGEFHPAAHIAMEYVKESLLKYSPFTLQEALASTAIEGNRLAEVASETLHRLLAKEPISDRYLMGLAWMLYKMDQNKCV